MFSKISEDRIKFNEHIQPLIRNLKEKKHKAELTAIQTRHEEESIQKTNNIEALKHQLEAKELELAKCNSELYLTKC